MTPSQSPRTSGAQLPSADEVLAILARESGRTAVKFDYIALHPQIFTNYHKLSKLAGSDDSWINNYPRLSLEELVDALNTSNEQLRRYISSTTPDTELLQGLYNSLIPAENLAQSDALFVFGAQTNARIERAIELYQEGIAPKIIISGHGPFYANTTEPEAVRMANVALAHGVPRSSIITEESSITLPDNVKQTLDLLEKRKMRPESVTIIATDFVLQRAVMEWYKFTPWSIEIRAAAAHSQSPAFTASGWYTSETVTSLVLNEYAKLVLESKVDLIRATSE